MAHLSTHVLDITQGIPASGVRLELYRLDDTGDDLLITSATTNGEGRTDSLLLSDNTMLVGTYEIDFFIAEYFQRCAKDLASPTPFLDIVPIRFTISDAAKNYHVPILVTPWSYSTYCGN